MGFRLTSFLGGMAEGALEMEKEHRERTYKLIDDSIEFNAERIMTADEERKEQLAERKRLAKVLSSFEGMDDEKIAVVLDYGNEVAQSFITQAPEIASKNRTDIGSLVSISAPAGEGFDLTNMIEKGGFEPVDLTPRLRDPELTTSPVLGSDYSDYARQRQREVNTSFGIPEDGFAAYEGPRPEGTIDMQSLLAPAKEVGEGLSITSAGLDKFVAETMVPLSNAGMPILPDGRLMYEDDEKEVATAINDLKTATAINFNMIKNERPIETARNPALIRQIALDQAIKAMPESTAALFPRLNVVAPPSQSVDEGAGTVDDTVDTQETPAPTGDVRSQIDAIENNQSLTDVQKRAKKRTVLRNAGLATTLQEADEILASGNY